MVVEAAGAEAVALAFQVEAVEAVEVVVVRQVSHQTVLTCGEVEAEEVAAEAEAAAEAAEAEQMARGEAAQ